MSAAAGNNRAPDQRFTPVASLPGPAVRAMVPLIIAFLAIRVKKIGDRGAAHHDGSLQNFSQLPPQPISAFHAQARS
jgi:hypothetical protein